MEVVLDPTANSVVAILWIIFGVVALAGLLVGIIFDQDWLRGPVAVCGVLFFVVTIIALFDIRSAIREEMGEAMEKEGFSSVSVIDDTTAYGTRDGAMEVCKFAQVEGDRYLMVCEGR